MKIFNKILLQLLKWHDNKTNPRNWYKDEFGKKQARWEPEECFKSEDESSILFIYSRPWLTQIQLFWQVEF